MEHGAEVVYAATRTTNEVKESYMTAYPASTGKLVVLASSDPT